MENFQEPVLAASGVHKRFGGIVALNDVSLEVLRGQVHALVGENGAGKSTLVKILTGAQEPDSGTVQVLGQTVHLTPEGARARGIGAVYQETSMIPQLSVLENMFLGHELRGRGRVLQRKSMKLQAEEALDRVGSNIRVSTRLGALSVAERQLVEIARALAMDANVLIFDEPSAILSGPELDRVFGLITELKQAGLGIVYISHRLSEIFHLADRVTVLKDGRVVAVRPVEGLTTDELIRLMVGRDISERPPRSAPRSEVVLEARALQLRPGRHPVGFQVHAGEVLGVAGLVGSGRTRIADALAGIRPASSGEILRNGVPVRIKNPADSIRARIAVIPEDRKDEGLVLAHSVRENVGLASLRELSSAWVVRRGDELQLAKETVERFDIRPPDPERVTATLSGGNQQKVVLGKWLARTPAPEVAVFDEPTRGVDVGAKYEIYRLIDELVEGGAGVLLISSELPEVIALSDRIAVMCNGEVAAVLGRDDFNEERILKLAVFGGESDGPDLLEPVHDAAVTRQGPTR